MKIVAHSHIYRPILALFSVMVFSWLPVKMLKFIANTYSRLLSLCSLLPVIEPLKRIKKKPKDHLLSVNRQIVYNLTIRRLTLFLAIFLFFSSFNLQAQITITSTATGGDWSDAASWVGGSIPGVGDNVIIDNDAAVTVSSATFCNSLTIDGTLLINGTNALQVNGDWTNNGTFTANSSVVTLGGTTNATISGSSPSAFHDLIINKGLDVNTVIEANGTGLLSNTGTLIINNGLFKMTTGKFKFGGSTGPVIPSTGGIWVNGSTFNSGDYSITNEGLIRISSGTANFGTQSGNSVHTQVDGAFEVTGGTVNIAGRLENTAGGTVFGTSIKSGITISNGTVTLSTIGNGLSNKGTLDVTTNGYFDFSGGTIIFQKASSAANAIDLHLVDGSGNGAKSITGGTFVFGNASTTPGSTFVINSEVPLPNLTTSPNANISLSNNLIISGILNLNRNLVLNDHSVRLPVSAIPGTFNFPLTNSSGNILPVNIDITSGTVNPGAYLELRMVEGRDPNNKNTSTYINRYWTVNTSGINNPNYNLTTHYLDGDVVGNEASLIVGSFNGSAWTNIGNPIIATNTIAITGITSNSGSFTGFSLPTVTISPSSTPICNGSSVTLTSTVTGDPIINYSWTSSPSGYSSSDPNPTVSPTVTTSYELTITDGNGFKATEKSDVSVTPANTITLNSGSGTDAQTVCINTPITNITYSTTGANGATVTNLLTGVTGTWSANVVTISGTPTVAGAALTYTVTLTGGCGTITTTGTIAVTANNTVNRISTGGTDAQTVCINTPITNITYSTTGANGATVTNLPTGVTGTWSGNVVTISGTPTVAGAALTYTVTLTGGCGTITTTGTIAVTANNTVNRTSTGGADAQTVCINTPITNITYSTTGATGATVTNLPTGVTGTWSGNVVTISGTPTVAGAAKTYTVTLTGGCGTITSTGTITVNSVSVGGVISPDIQVICSSSTLGNLALNGYIGSILKWQYSIDGGLNWSDISNTSNTYTPSIMQTTSYRAVVQSGTCPAVNSGTSTISLVAPFIPTITSNPSPSSICFGQSVALTASSGTFDGPFTNGGFSQSNPTGWLTNGSSNSLPSAPSNGNPGPWGRAPNARTFGGITYSSNSGSFAVVNGTFNSTLETPVFSLVGMTSAYLNLIQAIRLNSGAIASIQISVNGGTTYNTLPNANYIGPAIIGDNNGLSLNSFNLAAYLGQTNLRIRFNFAGSTGSVWAIDEVRISGTAGGGSFSNLVSYQWTPTDYLSPATGIGQTVTSTPTISGTFSYCVSATVNGCANQPVCTNLVVKAAVNFGTLSSSDQTICYNGDPSNITLSTAPSGGAGTFNYQWYYQDGLPTCPSGTNITGWTLINGATGTSYDPPTGLTGSRTYALMVDATGTPDCGVATWANGCRKVTVNPAVNYGTLTSADETICYNGDPSNITLSTAPSGGDGTFNYQWYYQDGLPACPSGTNVIGWTLITGATSNSYDPPTGLTGSRTYALMVDATGTPDCGVATWANGCRKVTVNAAVNYGTLTSADETICYNGDPSKITLSTAPSGGAGTFNYQWYYQDGLLTCPSGISTTGWTLITGATSNSYDPPTGLTGSRTYALMVDATGTPDCGVATWANGCRKVTVNPLPVLTAGSAVCVGSTMNLTPTTGGTWVSNNPSVATVTNSGVVTGVAAGNATFTFTDIITTCKATTSVVVVNPLPTTSAIYHR